MKAIYLSKKTMLVLFISSLFLFFTLQAQSQPDIQVQGLFSGKAVLNINGQLRMLSEGQTSPEGVRLISASTEKARIYYNDQEFDIDLSSRINSSYTAATHKEVRLTAGQNGHYVSTARINGRQAQVMLDTGASMIAMSSVEADRLGISYKSAPTSRASTAAGIVKTYSIKLNSVQLGAIELTNIDAAVIEGDFPEQILLGNSFLSRLQMRNEGTVMVLTAPF